jgi:dolichol-phosphate mannosyltransferase
MSSLDLQPRAAPSAPHDTPAHPTTLSIIIPVYNEKQLIVEIVRRALAAPLPAGWEREVVIVDDGSDDGTTQLLAHTGFPANVRVFSSLVNHGKGSALRAGFKLATGEVLLVQDGDLEYDPLENYGRLIEPFQDPGIAVVFGSRFLGCRYPEDMALANWLANKLLVWLVRLLYGIPITDEATGYKVFRRQVLASIHLECRGFEFCPEFTAKVSKAGFRITEVPVSYRGRNRLQGKKIRMSDGVRAAHTLLKWRFRS